MSAAILNADTHLQEVLRLADTSLILGQRLAEWCGHGPVLEEDIALTNIALDLIGQSRLLLTRAGELEGRGRDEDQLAFLRTESEFRNLTIVELPNGDFAQTMLRNLLVTAWQREQWQALLTSSDEAIAAIAAKSLKETRYHVQHSADWVVRLGDGTEQSHARAQRALDTLWPYTAEFFAEAREDGVDAASDALALASSQSGWEATVLPVLEVATLSVPMRSAFVSRGKFGVHTEHLGHLLTEMQVLQRTYPGGTW
ncbi:MAG: 1,2-phenylacetyl-CoA epoxidase subunit PaaC [Burkholderiaceae bacterium]